MTGIYKITNKISGKIYIGQAYDITRRLSVHKRGGNQDNQAIDKAIVKYGQDNFLYEIIEECSVDELNEREIYWIAHFNSYRKGYNSTTGGQGAQNLAIKLSSEDIEAIYALLIDYEFSQKEIASKFGVSEHTISDINRGKTRILEGYSFPLRKSTIQVINSEIKKGLDKDFVISNIETIEQNKDYCKCGKPKNRQAEMCEECYRKSTRVVERPDRDTLLKEIALTNFVAVGKKYGVTDNSIRKWCTGYDLPTHSKEIKELYNKEKGIVIPKKEKVQIYPVEQYDPLTGELLNTYPSAAAAARALGRSKGSHINEVCNGKGKTAHGFIWKYRK